MDVTRADFYEVGLLIKGLMPSSTMIDQSTQTEQTPAPVHDPHVASDAIPTKRATPDAWRSSLRPRPAMHVHIAHESRAMRSDTDVMEWAMSTADNATMLMAAQQLRYGTPLRIDTVDTATPSQAWTLDPRLH